MSSAERAIVKAADQAKDLALLCPNCASLVGETSRTSSDEQILFACSSCYTKLRCRDGVWNALSPAREAYYARFVANYEKVRAAEGRGSRNAEFYLALPYEDVTHRNESQWAIRARSFVCLDRQVLPLLEESGGDKLDVLDLGAGNGWLSYRLALRGHRPVAVDLLDNAFDGLGAAKHYQARLPNLFPRFRADLHSLPFGDRQFD
ncbi:MAG TPA: class I SAM-dependent methyltransferase, partial [Terriglobales bacterium]